MKKVQLFLLHFAGGNCYSFQFLRPLLKEFEFIALELPGRGKRFDEQLLTDFDLAALDIYKQVIAKLDGSSFLIYGHSMGAYLTLRVASMLESESKFPSYLIVSGNMGPVANRHSDRRPRYNMPKKVFRQELASMGGIPSEFLENEEMFELFEPVLRADFEIAERNKMIETKPVSAPIYAMMGDQEESSDEISNWTNYTAGDFKYEIMKGNHFFIQRHPQRVADIIRHCWYQSRAAYQR